MNKDWILTDPGTQQYGRFISDGVYEFKEKKRDTRVIDISEYSSDAIEDALNAYGYTHIDKPKMLKLQTLVTPDWILAECLYELDIKPK
jgi:hypothetical protein